MALENISTERIAKARAELTRRWDDEGACASCGWHAALYEHEVEDDDIADALRHGGRLDLSCQNRECGDPIGHRGVTIVLGIG